MTDDMGLRLLAAIEALQAEIGQLRSDLRDNVESTKILQANRAKKTQYQARWRAKVGAKCRISESTTPQVVKEDHDLDQDRKKKELQPVASTKNLHEARTAAVWNAYSEAFQAKYGHEPARNATVNGQLAHLVSRLGSEAPAVAAFYLGSRKSLHIAKRHSVGQLLVDYEGIRTDWKTGNRGTDTNARQQDQTQANLDGWEETRNELVAKRT